MPKKILTLVLALAAFAPMELAAADRKSSGANDRYVSVSGNDLYEGSAKHPWRTIQQAARSVRPGMTVHVSPGTYKGAIVTKVSGTPNMPIRFVSDSQWAARLVADSEPFIWLNFADYVVIEGFDVSGESANGIFNQASYVRIVGNHVHDIKTECSSSGGSGINNHNYRQGHDNEIVGNVVHHIGPYPGCPKLHGGGIYQANRRAYIANNLVHSNGQYGIHLWHAATDVTIVNNTTFNNRKGGILIGAGDDPGGVTADNCVVANNISVFNGFYGIRETGSTGTNNRYVNNLVFGNTPVDKVTLQNKLQDVGTIIADPQFVDYRSDGSGDYRLKPTSPAVSKADCKLAPAADLVRTARRLCDIGAYESSARVSTGR